jgi:DNA-binding NarL/FixJ family response regulator
MATHRAFGKNSPVRHIGLDHDIFALPAYGNSRWRDRNELDLLSPRELEIAVLISKGRTNQQIANNLALSHKTVETYLGRIFKKLGIRSRAQAAAIIGRCYHPEDSRYQDPG